MQSSPVDKPTPVWIKLRHPLSLPAPVKSLRLQPMGKGFKSPLLALFKERPDLSYLSFRKEDLSREKSRELSMVHS